MIKSMTSYGNGECRINNKIFIAEVKSLNNRYRDIILRIPNTLQVMEDEIRALISSRIQRGRIETSIRVENEGKEIEYNLELNLPLVRAYHNIFRKLYNEFGLDGNINPEYISQMKDVILIKPDLTLKMKDSEL